MKVFLSLLLSIASAYCAPTTTVEPSASTPSKHAPEDWEHFHRQVQVQVFQLSASVHELHQKVNQHTFDDIEVLSQVVARDRGTAKTIRKEVESESNRFTLDKNQQIFITETITTLDHLEKQLTKLHDTLAETVQKASTPGLALFEAETVATTVKIAATTAKIAVTTKSELQDFLKFYESISTELKTLESSVDHVVKEEKKPHLFGIGLDKLKDQINADLHQIQNLEKQIEVELKKTLTEEEKTIVVKFADSLKLLKKRADDVHNKLDKKHPITETPVTTEGTKKTTHVVTVEANKTTVAATTQAKKTTIASN